MHYNGKTLSFDTVTFTGKIIFTVCKINMQLKNLKFLGMQNKLDNIEGTDNIRKRQQSNIVA